MSEPAPPSTDSDAGAFEPGDVNAHTHLYSGLSPFGMEAPDPPPRSFLEILERVWWRLDRALDANSLRASARYYAASALLRGTTSVVDHHESPSFLDGSLDILADACQNLGLRAVLCFGATARNGGAAEGRRGLLECRRFILENRRPLVRGVIGLHASFTVHDETILEAASLCRELNTVLHVHVAEDLADIADARARGYKNPLERLLALGALPEGSILAHGVHLSEADVRLAEARGLWLVQCPRSNRNNRVGYPAALAWSDKVALGTDGFPSDMRTEAAVLRSLAIEHGDDMEAAERRLEKGRALVAERFNAISLPDCVRRAPAEASPENPGAVLDVLVDNQYSVRGGELVSGDMVAIEAEAREAAPGLWRRMRDLGAGK